MLMGRQNKHLYLVHNTCTLCNVPCYLLIIRNCYTLIFLQRNRQWNKSDVALTVGKVIVHECNKQIVTRQNYQHALGAQSGTNEFLLYHSWAATMNTNLSMAKRSTVVTTLANNCLGKAS